MWHPLIVIVNNFYNRIGGDWISVPEEFLLKIQSFIYFIHINHDLYVIKYLNNNINYNKYVLTLGMSKNQWHWFKRENLTFGIIFLWKRLLRIMWMSNIKWITIEGHIEKISYVSKNFNKNVSVSFVQPLNVNYD